MKLPDNIICNNNVEFVECAKFLQKLGHHVVNFDGQNFIRVLENEKWMDYSFNYEENAWGRFYTNNKKINNSIEFKYLLRKDKLNKLNTKN